MRTHWLSGLVLLASLAPPLPAADDLPNLSPIGGGQGGGPAADDLGEGKPATKAQAAVAAEGKPRSSEPIDYLDFVFVASDRPVLLRLHLRNGNRPYSAAWDDYMQKFYTYLDRNGDGVLNKDEAERAPNIQFLQFHLQGAIGFPYQASKGQMAQFDTNKDGKVSLAEFGEFYRRGGIQPLQFSTTSNQAATDSVTKTIYKRLDSNKDGKLSAEEMARAPAILQRFDLDENEMFTAMELTPGGEDSSGYIFGFNNGGMAAPNADMGFLEFKPDTLDGVSRRALTHYDKDKNGKLSQKEVGLDKPLFDRLDLNHDGQLDAKEFAGFLRRDADLELIARVGNLAQKQGNVSNLLRKIGMSVLPGLRTEVFNPKKRAMPLADKVQRDGASALGFSLGDANIGLSASDQQFGQFPRQFFEQQFREADAGKKGVVDRKQAMTAQFLSQIFDLVDRNGDSKVTEKELKSYLDMQSEGAGCRLQLTITDEGRGIFDLLDEDSDSRVSLRELRSSWSRMKPLAKSDSGLARPDIPRRVDVSVGQAQGRFRRVVRTSSGVPVRKGTIIRTALVWFQKMDRNGDGDISPREFIGSEEDFRKLDTDGDGLISGEEASQFEQRLKKENNKKR